MRTTRYTSAKLSPITTVTNENTILDTMDNPNIEQMNTHMDLHLNLTQILTIQRSKI